MPPAWPASPRPFQAGGAAGRGRLVPVGRTSSELRRPSLRWWAGRVWARDERSLTLSSPAGRLAGPSCSPSPHVHLSQAGSSPGHPTQPLLGLAHLSQPWSPSVLWGLPGPVFPCTCGSSVASPPALSSGRPHPCSLERTPSTYGQGHTDAPQRPNEAGLRGLAPDLLLSGAPPQWVAPLPGAHTRYLGQTWARAARPRRRSYSRDRALSTGDPFLGPSFPTCTLSVCARWHPACPAGTPSCPLREAATGQWRPGHGLRTQGLGPRPGLAPGHFSGWEGVVRKAGPAGPPLAGLLQPRCSPWPQARLWPPCPSCPPVGPWARPHCRCAS